MHGYPEESRGELTVDRRFPKRSEYTHPKYDTIQVERDAKDTLRARLGKVSFNRGEDLAGQVEGCDDVCGSERIGAISAASIATAFLCESTIPTEAATRAEELLIQSLTYTNVSSAYSNNR